MSQKIERFESIHYKKTLSLFKLGYDKAAEEAKTLDINNCHDAMLFVTRNMPDTTANEIVDGIKYGKVHYQYQSLKKLDKKLFLDFNAEETNRLHDLAKRHAEAAKITINGDILIPKDDRYKFQLHTTCYHLAYSALLNDQDYIDEADETIIAKKRETLEYLTSYLEILYMQFAIKNYFGHKTLEECKKDIASIKWPSSFQRDDLQLDALYESFNQIGKDQAKEVWTKLISQDLTIKDFIYELEQVMHQKFESAAPNLQESQEEMQIAATQPKLSILQQVILWLEQLFKNQEQASSNFQSLVESSKTNQNLQQK